MLSSACSFHCGMTNNWGTAGGVKQIVMCMPRRISEEYKLGGEQGLVKGERLKEICFNYAEKGQLLWWQIVKHATTVRIINNPYVDKTNTHYILIVEIKCTVHSVIGNACPWESSFFYALWMFLLHGFASTCNSLEKIPIILTWIDM